MSLSLGSGTTEPPKLPGLDVWTVEDDDELWDAIRVLVRAEASSSRRLADIEDWIDVLSACVADDGVLRVAAEVRVRVLAEAEELALAIARWAFAEGRRHPLPSGEGAP
jgi:hypothetical protein